MSLNVSLFFIALCLCLLGGCTKKSSDILHIDRDFTFPSGFPPDPGEVGKRTLEGVDSDHDGLRDDVQRWIYARYPTDEQKRKALRQMALSYQADLKQNLHEQELKAINQQEDKAIECLHKRFSENLTAPTVELEYVKAKVLNTKERAKQFLEFDAQFDGKTLGPFSPDDGTACEK